MHLMCITCSMIPYIQERNYQGCKVQREQGELHMVKNKNTSWCPRLLTGPSESLQFCASSGQPHLEPRTLPKPTDPGAKGVKDVCVCVWVLPGISYGGLSAKLRCAHRKLARQVPLIYSYSTFKKTSWSTKNGETNSTKEATAGH